MAEAKALLEQMPRRAVRSGPLVALRSTCRISSAIVCQQGTHKHVSAPEDRACWRDYICGCRPLVPFSCKKMNHQSPHIDKTVDHTVRGVVYEARLLNVPRSEVHYGTPYIGQSVRKGFSSFAAVAEARWNREIADGAKSTKQHGFMGAIKMFGPHAFNWKVLETKIGTESEVQEWADVREQELIAENGGTLQEAFPCVPQKQCFNMQKGGKLNRATWWSGVEAYRKQRWSLFAKHLRAHVFAHNTADVPRKHKTSDGYRLGAQVNKVRCGRLLDGRPDEAMRRAWLEQLPGWTWKIEVSERMRRATKGKTVVGKKSQADAMRKLTQNSEFVANRVSKFKKTIAKRNSWVRTGPKFAATIAARSRAKLEEARRVATPYVRQEALKGPRGAYYVRCGEVGRWDGKALRILGPA